MYTVVFCVTDFILDGLLAKKVFSEAGSISLTMEQSTYVFFRRLLNEVEGNWNCYCCVF